MAIDAKELRIGNWVLQEYGHPIKVGRIQRDRFFETEDNSFDRLTKNCNGIPLTTEILLKCGFSLQPQRISIYVNGRIKLWLGSNGVIAYLMHEDKDESFWIANPIQSLHQLQNLYFCLTGTELKIENL